MLLKENLKTKERGEAFMFCINCGRKLIEGAKFCANCGTKLAELGGESQKETIVEEKDSKVDLTVQVLKNFIETREKVIEEVFSNSFRIRGEFGKQVSISGKDNIILEANTREHFLTENSKDKILMVFYYSDHFDKGFVITNRRIAWDYGSGVSEIYLTDIKSVEIGKAVLATIMKLTSYHNETYPEIYLTGIDGEAKFVAKFRKFVDTIHKRLYGDNDNQKNNSSEQKNMDFIVSSYQGMKLDDLFFEVGNPIRIQSSKKYEKAQLYFNIPSDEEIFFIYDDTVMGSCKKGFALCSSGYYYCTNRSGYIPWEQFAEIDISKCFAGIKIGREEFTPQSGDCKKLITILKNIQENLT